MKRKAMKNKNRKRSNPFVHQGNSELCCMKSVRQIKYTMKKWGRK